MVYGTGVAFTVVVLSKGVSRRGEDHFEEPRLGPSSLDLGSGSLKFGAHGAPVNFKGWSRGENRLLIEAWSPFPPGGDVVCYVEWPAEGIEHSEFRVPAVRPHRRPFCGRRTCWLSGAAGMTS